LGRQQDELWAKAFALLGIRMEVQKLRFPDQIKAEKECKIMMRTASWIADYPDADNFMQLLSSANIGQSNYACYSSPEFDRMYLASQKLPDSAERNAIYREMNRRLEADTVWKLGVSRLRTMLIQPTVKAYKKHPILHAEWAYIDVEPQR
jgi:ABC-type oligopeptide transport system substrate-binding subunit